MYTRTRKNRRLRRAEVLGKIRSEPEKTTARESLETQQQLQRSGAVFMPSAALLHFQVTQLFSSLLL